MYNIEIKTSTHQWTKTNLVTKTSRRGSYDEMKCEGCGMVGRRVTLDAIQISESYSMERVNMCPKHVPPPIPHRIRVIRCGAFGTQFKNATPDSEHDVIDPPPPYKNDMSGVWIMGNGEPIKLLNDEFTKI